MAKAAVTITTQHCCVRKQFGSEKTPGAEVPIIEHPLVHRKICCFIGQLFVASFALRHCGKLFAASTAVDKKFLHTIASGFNSVITWDLRDMITVCRELLGGQGFIMRNRVGTLIAHEDLLTTGEGDNTMLMKEMIRAILSPAWSRYDKLLEQSKKVQGFVRIRALLGKWRTLAGLLRAELIDRTKKSGIDYELDFGLEVARLFVRIFNTDSSLPYVEECSRSGNPTCSEILEAMLYLDAWKVCEHFNFHLLRHNLMTPEDFISGAKHFRNLCEKHSKNALTLTTSFGIPAASMPRSNLFGPLDEPHRKSNL
jgi:hypothetical protein